MNKKIVVAGHICLDITPKFPETRVEDIKKLLVAGSTVITNGIEVYVGGCVGNCGLALKAFEADVTLMAKIGNDEFAAMLNNILDKHGVKRCFSTTDRAGTAYSIVLALPGLDRIFIHDPGADNIFMFDDVDFSIVKDAALFHFGYPPLMRSMHENGGSELLRIFKHVNSLGVSTSLDMAVIDPKSSAGSADWESIIRSVLPYVDFFVPSFEELASMMDRPMFARLRNKAGNGDITEILTLSDVSSLADKLINWGAKVIMIKCGARGIYLRTASNEKLSQIGGHLISDTAAWADKEVFEQSYVPSRVLSATGAGDVCIAAFLKSVIDGYGYNDCLKLAVAAGASSVETYDSFSGLVPFSKLFDKINSGWEKHKWDKLI